MTDGGSSEGRRREVISKREVTGWRPLTLAGATSRLGAPPPRRPGARRDDSGNRSDEWKKPTVRMSCRMCPPKCPLSG